MRTITLKREKSFSQCAMLFQVKCDGRLVATLKNGEEKKIELDETKHSVQCFADTVALDIDKSSTRLYSDLLDIPESAENFIVNFKPGFASIKAAVTNESGEQADFDAAKPNKKKKFSIGIFLLLTLITGIGGIIYAIIKLLQKD